MEADERSLADPCGGNRRGDAASPRESHERIFTDRPPPMRRRSRLGRAMQRMFWCLVLLLMMPGEGTLLPAGIVELGGVEGGSAGWRDGGRERRAPAPSRQPQIPVAGGMEGASRMEGGSSGPQLRQWRVVEVPRDFPTVLDALQLRLPGTQIKVQLSI